MAIDTESFDPLRNTAHRFIRERLVPAENDPRNIAKFRPTSQNIVGPPPKGGGGPIYAGM